MRGGLVQNLYSFAKADAAPDLVLMLGARFGLNTGHGSGQLIPIARRSFRSTLMPASWDACRASLWALWPMWVGPSRLWRRPPQDAAWPDRGDWCAKVTDLAQERYASIAAKSSSEHALHLSRLAGHCQTRRCRGDGGSGWCADYLWLSSDEPRETRRFLCHGYLGSMGVGFGTALGAQVADLEAGRRTILVTGDGSVGYSIGEFDTLVRKQLPLIVIIMNNQSWGRHCISSNWPSAPIA
jgi:acetolactate synthase-1/2/3 large subunit